MDPEVLPDVVHVADGHHRKPKHMAEKLESYVGIFMVAVAVILLALLLYGVTQTGTTTPNWMLR